MGIHVLPTLLVNKIAAGEVIERPASVVKELVENALDADATRIDVTIEDGGRKLIAVSDTGVGMGPDDLELAFAPHATSKLTDEEDLFRIGTLGFRGEALASIASISRAHLRSCRRGRDEAGGYEVDASGGTVSEVRPCPAPPGTTVTIRDLFFNTPARRKFMRTANTESAHVTEQVTRLALPHPEVAFTLTHNGRSVHNLAPAETTLARAADLFGGDLAESLTPLLGRGDDHVSVSGLIAPPSAARGSGKWQYFFLNGRYIRDRLLSHAVREAYRGLIEPSRWPVVFLFIEIDPAEVDVNVHPTKMEVRFRDSQRIHGELLAALRETLSKANLTPRAEMGGPLDGVEGEGRDPKREASLREALADFFKSAPPPQPRLNFPSPAAAPHHGGPRPPWPTTGGHATQTAHPPAAVRADQQSEFGAIQIHRAYIVAPVDDGLVIIDQHALHERLIYNELRARLTEAPLTAQKLLIPETVVVTPAEADRLHNHADLLGQLGIEVAAFGPNTVAVQQFPSLLVERRVPIGQFLHQILDTLADDETAEAERLLENLLEVMACKAAVKSGDPLAPGEIDSLLARRDSAEKGSSCPHGRPTTLKLSLGDLEKQFKRS